MAKGQHRPNKQNAKRRREQRKAAARQTLEMERNKAKSACAAAAEPDQSDLERRAMIQGYNVPPWMQPECIDHMLDIITDTHRKASDRIAAFRTMVLAEDRQIRREMERRSLPAGSFEDSALHLHQHFHNGVVNGSPQPIPTQPIAEPAALSPPASQRAQAIAALEEFLGEDDAIAAGASGEGQQVPHGGSHFPGSVLAEPVQDHGDGQSAAGPMAS
jgi:hypothetical protein